MDSRPRVGKTFAIGLDPVALAQPVRCCHAYVDTLILPVVAAAIKKARIPVVACYEAEYL